MSKKNLMDCTPNALKGVLEQLFGVVPTDVQGQWNLRTWYYRERLLRRCLSIFNFDGIPEGWDEEWLKLQLFGRGYVCVGNTKSFGVIPMKCSYSGVNVYNRPTRCVVSTHLLSNLKFTIGVDCVLMKLQYNYRGIDQLLAIYSQKLANVDGSIDVNLLNTRTPVIFDCDGKAQEETAKRMYDDITAGKPVVFRRSNESALNSDGKLNFIYTNPKQSYISDMLQDEKRSIMYEFLTELGINNSNVDKKERVNTLEVAANDDELNNSVDDWKFNLELACSEINSMFGLNISVNFPYYREKEFTRVNEKEGDASGSDTQFL